MARRMDVPPSKAKPRTTRRDAAAENAEKAKPSDTAAPKPDHSKKAAARKRAIKKQVPMPESEDPLPEDFQAIFGENLKAARLKSGLKQSDVAEQAGLTQQRLSQIENGRQNVTLRTMVKLAAVVGHNIGALLSKVKAKRVKG